MRALCYAQTNIGSGRDNNEDNYYCNGTFKRDPAIPVAEAAAEQESKRLIYGVFDGMGGEANGEQAALLCAQTLHACSSDEPFNALDFFRRANVAVCDMIAASGQISGSTAATVHLTGNHAYCCNVGDSRIGSEMRRRTRDAMVQHHLMEQMVRDIRTLLSDSGELSEEDNAVYLWDDRRGQVANGRLYGAEGEP